MSVLYEGVATIVYKTISQAVCKVIMRGLMRAARGAATSMVRHTHNSHHTPEKSKMKRNLCAHCVSGTGAWHSSSSNRCARRRTASRHQTAAPAHHELSGH